jgi:hypothetical protein
MLAVPPLHSKLPDTHAMGLAHLAQIEQYLLAVGVH